MDLKFNNNNMKLSSEASDTLNDESGQFVVPMLPVGPVSRVMADVFSDSEDRLPINLNDETFAAATDQSK